MIHQDHKFYCGTYLVILSSRVEEAVLSVSTHVLLLVPDVGPVPTVLKVVGELVSVR